MVKIEIAVHLDCQREKKHEINVPLVVLTYIRACMHMYLCMCTCTSMLYVCVRAHAIKEHMYLPACMYISSYPHE